MKHIKHYEHYEEIEYCVGDTVYCIDEKFDKGIGKKFIVNEIYTYVNKTDFPFEKMFLNCIKTNQLNDDHYLNVVAGRNTHFGIRASKFINEKNYNILIAQNKYNL